MNTYLLVTTTTDSLEAAENLGNHLIEQRLAACVQVTGPTTSIYTWQEKVAQSEEWLVSVKTRSNLFEIVSRTIKENHSYELPEIIAVKLEMVDQAYTTWMEEQLVPKS